MSFLLNLNNQVSPKFSSTLLSISTIIFLLYTAQSLFRPILPRYIETIGGSAADIGFIIFFNWLIQALISIPSGSLSDKIGKRTTIILGGLIAAIGFFIIPYASNIFLILLVYGFAGIGQAGYSTATAVYSIDMAQSKHVSRAIGWTQAARQSALSFGPAIGGVLVILLGINLVFVASALIVLTAVFFSRVFLPEIRIKTSKIDVKSTGKIILKNPLILSSLIGIFTLQFANSVFSSFTPIYAKELSFVSLGVVFAVQGAMNMVGRPVIGELSSKIKNRTLVVSIAMFMSFVGLFLLNLSTSFELLVFVAIFVGLSTGIGVVLMLIIIVEQVPKENKGFAIGFFNMALYLGLGVGPAVEGIVIDNFGYNIAFQTAGVIPLIGLMLFSIIPRLKK